MPLLILPARTHWYGNRALRHATAFQPGISGRLHLQGVWNRDGTDQSHRCHSRCEHTKVARPSRWRSTRSEEHTSELQSLMRISYAVFCLKKKNTNKKTKSDVISNQEEQEKDNT